MVILFLVSWSPRGAGCMWASMSVAAASHACGTPRSSAKRHIPMHNILLILPPYLAASSENTVGRTSPSGKVMLSMAACMVPAPTPSRAHSMERRLEGTEPSCRSLCVCVGDASATDTIHNRTGHARCKARGWVGGCVGESVGGWVWECKLLTADE